MSKEWEGGGRGREGKFVDGKERWSTMVLGKRGRAVVGRKKRGGCGSKELEDEVEEKGTRGVGAGTRIKGEIFLEGREGRAMFLEGRGQFGESKGGEGEGGRGTFLKGKSWNIWKRQEAGDVVPGKMRGGWVVCVCGEGGGRGERRGLAMKGKERRGTGEGDLFEGGWVRPQLWNVCSPTASQARRA